MLVAGEMDEFAFDAGRGSVHGAGDGGGSEEWHTWKELLRKYANRSNDFLRVQASLIPTEITWEPRRLEGPAFAPFGLDYISTHIRLTSGA